MKLPSLNALVLHRLLFLLCCVLLVYISYRGHQTREVAYERIPDMRIFDERNYALQGLSIRHSGIPMAWSDLTVYEQAPDIDGVALQRLNITFNGVAPNFESYDSFPKPLYSINEFDIGKGKENIKFVQPFFDHPPLGGLITSLGVPGHVSDFSEVKPEHFRKPMLIIAIITSFLIFTYATLNYSPFVGIIATAIYNSLPIFVLSSKYALLENILSPIALFGLILLTVTKKLSNEKKRLTAILLLFSALALGLGVVTKETGIAFLIAGMAILITWKYPGKKILLFFFSGLIPLSAYVIWGLILAPKFFLKVIMGNADREFFGPLNFLSALETLKFELFPVDGWWLWSFVALLIITIYKRKNYKLVVIPALTFILLLLFLSNLNYPWYWLPLVPFLTISMGIVIQKLILKPTLPVILTFALLPLSSSLYWGQMVQSHSPEIGIYRLIVFGLLALGGIRLIKSNVLFVKYLWIITVIILLIITYRWNRRANNYILFNWDNLPQGTYFVRN